MLEPELLQPDNFTPPTRTPWGGTRLLERYKRDVPLATRPTVVGESWEVSVEPSFPSRLVSGGTLAEAIARDPVGWLGAATAEAYGDQTPLLVKLLDARDDLSVQVHPADGDPALAPDESGKPEAWVVLDADPGAALYLGFRDRVTREDVAACLAEQGPLDALLQRVPVSPGDAFVIRAGTPHAIGAGLTLLEPQLVRPGRRGLTYRFWDWNRRYDPRGRRSDDGQPRPLHVARSLEVTAWDAPRGEAFVATCRAHPTVLAAGPVTRTRVIDAPWFVTERWAGDGAATLPAAGTMWALTCVAGVVRVGDLELRRGWSCVVPASFGAAPLIASGAVLFAVRCTGS